MAFICLVYFFLAAQGLTRESLDLHQFRQTQTLSTIFNFYENGVAFLRPEIDTNGSHSVVVLEFPFYQAIVAWTMSVFGYHEAIARLVSIFSSLGCGLLLASLAGRYVSEARSPVLAFFLLNPSNIFWGGVALVDPFALMLAVVCIWTAFRWVDRGGAALYLGWVAVGCLAILVKPTSAFIPFISFFPLILIKLFRNDDYRKLGLLFAGAVTVSMALLSWVLYSKSMHAINPHPYTESSVEWLLGTWGQRRSSDVWIAIVGRYASNGFGLLGVVGVGLCLVTALLRRRWREVILPLWLVAVGLAYLAIFINLNFVHSYYQLPLSVPIALLAGWGLVKMLQLLPPRGMPALLAGVVVLVAITLGFFSKRVLASGWKDLAPISSPYQQSSCERDLAAQSKQILDDLGIEVSLIGVSLDTGDGCWNGPHAFMYHSRLRGYLSREIGSQLLHQERLDLILAIHRDAAPAMSGFLAVKDGRFKGAVSGFRYRFFIPAPAHSWGEYELPLPDANAEGHATISGTPGTAFNHGIRIDPRIPPFSQVTARFKVANAQAAGGGNGYFLLRTYTGGYGYDQFREFVVPSDGSEVELCFNLQTGNLEDYVLEIGKKYDGAFKVLSPVRIATASVFARVHEQPEVPPLKCI